MGGGDVAMTSGSKSFGEGQVGLQPPGTLADGGQLCQATLGIWQILD